jgi:hypothetical protein
VIRSVRFTAASDPDAERGLLVYVKFDLGPIIFDSVTLRRYAGGQLGLSWSDRTDRQGWRHSLVRPVHGAARRDLEGTLLRALTEQELNGNQSRGLGERNP